MSSTAISLFSTVRTSVGTLPAGLSFKYQGSNCVWGGTVRWEQKQAREGSSRAWKHENVQRGCV